MLLPTEIVALALTGLLLGAWVYCLLTIVAVRKYLRQPVPAAESREPVSILKPLAGMDEGLEENLRGFFAQEYPEFELLFAVRTEADPACALVDRLRGEFPGVSAAMVLVGEPPWANAKSWSLHQMQQRAKHSLLVMSDSDIRVGPDFLGTVVREFSDPNLAVATCLYRAVPGQSFWSRLEAIGMNTEFLSGVLVARMLEGVRFTLGPTVVARREAVEAVGGWPYLREFLAEDFVLGHDAAARGFGVGFSRYVVEHRIGSQGFLKNASHRLRWCRSTRRSRPAGYVGQLFTNPLPIALALVAAWPAAWPLLTTTIVLRGAAALATAGGVLHDPLCARYWYLIPLQDLASFAFWVAGFFGNTIEWRGEHYRIERDGRFRK